MNIFKRKQTNSNYPAIVQEIHNEFECASDVLVAECEAALSQLKEAPIEKANLLQSLGFTKTKEVVETRQVEMKKHVSKQVIELVSYYGLYYPNNKFITNEQVTAICEKYDLICGDVGRFTGFVPEVKLKQIAGFKLKERDMITHEITESHNGNGSDVPCNIPFDFDKDLTDWGKSYFESHGYFHIMDQNGVHGHTKRMVTEECEARFSGLRYVELQPIKGSQLQICAPLKDMDTSGMRVENRRLVREIPDPVVLQPVRGGYLILAMWADENFDPHKEAMLINETMN